MQQRFNEPNARSAKRPILWFTLALHLVLGGYIYFKTTAPQAASAPTSMSAKP
jgi:hypothetical protein